MTTQTLTAPAAADAKKLTRKDFLSETQPRWCPGCGSYGVLAALTKVMPTLGIPKENFALISGIGCSSRLPYYASTYGFHTIHGRAPAIATGLKLNNPDLSVWVLTGDGDALSIGGNHFMHLMRRNLDIKVILFNNQIYGLTKGQASPTTVLGTKTKSTPHGSVDNPIRPLSLAIAAGATFAARVPDTDMELIGEVLTAAAKHKGVAFIEVLLNCVIFNDGAFSPLTDKDKKAETTLRLKHGEPMLYGENREKGLRMSNLRFESVHASQGGVITHDAACPDSGLAYALSLVDGPDLPVPMGIFRQVSATTYEERALVKAGESDFAKVFRGGNSWVVDEKGETRRTPKGA